jgi:hypothetical protein
MSTRRSGGGVRRGSAARGRSPRPLHGSVHLRRTRDRLARQQQHRRIDLRADGEGAASDPDLDRRQRGNGGHLRDDRPLDPLPQGGDAALCRRPRVLGVLRSLRRSRVRGGLLPAVTHRGHRAQPRRAVVHPVRDRPHGARPRRDEPRDRPGPRAHPAPPRRRLDRHQRLDDARTRGRDARTRRAGQHRLDALRCRLPVPQHVLRRRLAARAGHRRGARGRSAGAVLGGCPARRRRPRVGRAGKVLGGKA